MTIKRKLSEPQIFELRDHRDNTAWELVKCYSIAQLSYMDGIDEKTVKHSNRYLPVRVDSGPALYRYKNWENSKPYRIMYIRLDEIRALYKRRTWNTLAIELWK